MPLPEPIVKVEHEDGTGGDLPGWYLRRYAVMPIKVPPGGGVSIAGPFLAKQTAQRFLERRLAEPGALARMLPIQPADLMRRTPDLDAAQGERDVAMMRQAHAAAQAAKGKRKVKLVPGGKPSQSSSKARSALPQPQQGD